MFVVVGVTGVYGMEGVIPLLVVIILGYGYRLGNLSRDKELLFLKVLWAFVQLWRCHPWLSVLGRRWYPM